MKREDLLVEVFGKENLNYFLNQKEILDIKENKIKEFNSLNKKANNAFNVNLSITDISIATATGVMLGLANALFKDFVPKHGKFSHKHGVTRTAVDYQIAKPKSFKGSVQNLHRQIGPSHDIFRFNEGLKLISGETGDFDLWGSKATEILGHQLRPGNMKLNDFLQRGGFRVPSDPKKELLNHLVIDFFTRRSLPIPGSTLLADKSPEMAKLMLNMYDKGLNLKNLMGNFIGFMMVQLILHSYTFIFKAIPESDFQLNSLEISNFKNLMSTYLKLIKNNDFHMMMVISHGASFLIDTIITTSTKSYAGLFQLNYLSLLAFSKHILQYLYGSYKEYNKLIKEIQEKKSQINDLEKMWNKKFKSIFRENINSMESVHYFDIEKWKKQKNTINKLKNMSNETKNLYKQLEEF
jgi:hypothetical protein